jgi:hypothetical protein
MQLAGGEIAPGSVLTPKKKAFVVPSPSTPLSWKYSKKNLQKKSSEFQSVDRLWGLIYRGVHLTA